jgi:hypothetical protein
VSPREHGPWRARFLDGPCTEQEHVFAVGPVWREIRLVLLSSVPGTGWKIIGGDGIPDTQPWPGEERYRLAEVIGDDPLVERIALYRLG